MNRFEPTTESGKKIETQETHEAPRSVEKSAEEISSQMIEQSGKEVADFQQEGAAELAQSQARAEKDGLHIDGADKQELGELSSEADVAKQELEGELFSKSEKLKNKEASTNDVPKFIRDFSKEESQEERDQTAKEIREKRNENKELYSSSIEKDKNLGEQLERIENLKNTISDLSENGVSKLMNYFKLKDLRAKLADENGSYDKTKNEEVITPDMEEPKRMLDAFYADQKKKWKDAPYSKEDIKKNFSEEHLTSLSVEEYALLLQRFPQEMVAHVTRQGIRDHTGHVFHTAGEGEYAEGFMKILKDGRLRSPMGVHMIEGMKEKTVEKYLELERFDTKEKAQNYLDSIANPSSQADPGGYADRMAVHFAAEEVADAYYGSEKGNEIFIAYPSAHIASQYHFDGQLDKSGGGYWNDQWVWANEEKGMNINAGLVFIPKEARVDAKTGSRYELDENGAPVVDNENIKKILEVLESAEMKGSISVAEKILGETVASSLRDRNGKIISSLDPHRKLLEEKFGIKDEKIQMSILNYNLISSFKIYEDDPERKIEVVKNTLTDNGVYYKEAPNHISSQEFWENYFSQHPEQRPSKIVYYKGDNPTDALHDWKKSNGLGRKFGDWGGDLAERKVDRNSPEATSGRSRFSSIAEKIINEHYGGNSQMVAEG